jgi:SPP1 gp7 family putative phage head morphogenesis protein
MLNYLVFDFDFGTFWENQDDSLFNYYLNQFQTPIEDLLNKEEYPELFAKFKQNAYEFALAKASTFIEKSKGMSRAEAKTLLEKMNRHNETEKIQFALAVQAAQEWQEILKDAETTPNLEYRAVLDENTRESHASLNGIIKPIKDEFWNSYFPPIDYRCRCSVRQLNSKAKITQTLPENLPAIPKGLGHNPGESGQAFNFAHTYFDNTNDTALKNVQKYAAYSEQYKKEYFDIKTGGYLVVNKKANTKTLEANLLAGKVLAKNGYTVEVNKEELAGYTINGSLSELKTPTTKNAEKIIYNSIKKAKERSGLNECVVFLSAKKYNIEKLLFGLEKAFESKKSFQKIIIIRGEKTAEITRKDLGKAKSRLQEVLK